MVVDAQESGVVGCSRRIEGDVDVVWEGGVPGVCVYVYTYVRTGRQTSPPSIAPEGFGV